MSSSSEVRRSPGLPGEATLLALGALLGLLSPVIAAEEKDRLPDPPVTPPLEWSFSAEAGYRTLNIDGNEDLYRSQVNLYDGGRIFDFSLRAAPQDPGAGYFDALEIDASGLGGDPRQWAHLSLRRHGVYRWDLKYDRSEYFFSVPDFALGQHTNDNLRQTLDSLLEFHPGRSRVYVGFARRDFDGPAFLTQDLARDEFLVFAPADRQTDDARAGIDFPLGRWDLNLEQGYRKLETFSEYELPSGSGAGNNPANNATLSSFLRTVPLDGEFLVTRASAHAAFADRVEVSLRLVRSDGETEGSSLQTAAGTWFTTGAPAFTETVTAAFGSDLPSSLAEVGVSVRLAESVSLHNTIRYHDYEIDGGTREDIDRMVAGLPSTLTSETFTRLTDWTAWEARTEAEWRPDRHWTLRGGYRRLDREAEFRSEEFDNTTVTVISSSTEAGDQASDTVFASASFRPGPRWSAHLDLRDGEVDNVFLRVDPADFQQARLRLRFLPTERWSFGLRGSVGNAENPNPDVENDVDSRSYSFDATFAGTRFDATAGYTAVNVDSRTDIVFCTGSPCTPGDPSQVSAVSQWSFADNHYFGDLRYRFGNRFIASLRGEMTDSRDTFPVDFYHVEPGVSVRLHGGYWLNAGWYRYEFDREQDDSQDYSVDGARISLAARF